MKKGESKYGNLIGKKFNFLTVINKARKIDRNGDRCWLCLCDCGTKKVIRQHFLVSGKTKSCKCINNVKTSIEMLKTHLLKNVKINRYTDCWIWQRTISSNGYGAVSIFGLPQFKGRRLLTVHRASAMLFLNFDINSNLMICHKCDNKLCINPKHLFIGTQKDNMADCSSKGRSCRGERHGVARLTENDVIKIRNLFDSKNFTSEELSKKFGISSGAMWCITHRKTWKYLT